MTLPPFYGLPMVMTARRSLGCLEKRREDDSLRFPSHRLFPEIVVPLGALKSGRPPGNTS